MVYFLSLGSNLGHRRKNLSQAISRLEEGGVRVLKASRIYESAPVGFRDQGWFLNQVLEVQTRLSPHSLLYLAKAIEKQMGRQPAPPKGPRCIDIDILLAGDRIIRSEDLQIPHPEMEKRNFVLVPFMEISPQTIHPVLNEKIEDLCKRSRDASEIRLYAEAA